MNNGSKIIANGKDSQGRTVEVIEREDGSLCLYYNMGAYHMVLFDGFDTEAPSPAQPGDVWPDPCPECDFTLSHHPSCSQYVPDGPAQPGEACPDCEGTGIARLHEVGFEEECDTCEGEGTIKHEVA